MAFLKRVLGGEPGGAGPTATDPAADEEDERRRELDLLREEQARHDDLIDRQLRYAHLAWQPPAQGGERRADAGGEEP